MVAFMTTMIAQVMRPVAIMIGTIIVLAQFSIALALSVAQVLIVAAVVFIVATVAPVVVIIAIKMAECGDSIWYFLVSLCCLIVSARCFLAWYFFF